MDTRSCISIGELIPSLIRLHKLPATNGPAEIFSKERSQLQGGMRYWVMEFTTSELESVSHRLC
jgi:hypothetical protein